MDVQKVQNNTHKEEKDPSNPLQQQEPQLAGMEISGNKRTHGSEGSDSDKYSPINTVQLSIVTASPNTEGWRKVEKKKGRKEYIYFLNVYVKTETNHMHMLFSIYNM